MGAVIRTRRNAKLSLKKWEVVYLVKLDAPMEYVHLRNHYAPLCQLVQVLSPLSAGMGNVFKIFHNVRILTDRLLLVQIRRVNIVALMVVVFRH